MAQLNLGARREKSPVKRSLVLAVAIVATLGILVALTACGTDSGAGASAGAGSNASAGSDTPSSAGSSDQASGSNSAKAEEPTIAVTKDADLVIPVAGISKKASFFPVEVGGTKLEVIAVKAPDGTIRTAFNTCQVCYDSGQGYYIQKGSNLECQSCGNLFAMEQVEILSGGCNPVPIFPADKTVTDESITVPLTYLQEAKAIFANWKTN
jgi:hypothetical protein